MTLARLFQERLKAMGPRDAEARSLPETSETRGIVVCPVSSECRPAPLDFLVMGPAVGPAGVGVADLGGEELEEPIGGAVACGADERWSLCSCNDSELVHTP